MTPKEKYDARKAERKKRQEALETLGRDDANERVEEILDRFVTAVERIADVMEATSPEEKSK